MVWPSHGNKAMEAVQELSRLLSKGQAAAPSPRIAGIDGTLVPSHGCPGPASSPRLLHQRWSCPSLTSELLGRVVQVASSRLHHASVIHQPVWDREQEQGQHWRWEQLHHSPRLCATSTKTVSPVCHPFALCKYLAQQQSSCFGAFAPNTSLLVPHHPPPLPRVLFILVPYSK